MNDLVKILGYGVLIIVAIGLILALTVGTWWLTGWVLLWLLDIIVKGFRLELLVPHTFWVELAVGAFISIIASLFKNSSSKK